MPMMLYSPKEILNMFPRRLKSSVKPSIRALPMLDLSMNAQSQMPNSQGSMWSVRMLASYYCTVWEVPLTITFAQNAILNFRVNFENVISFFQFLRASIFFV